MLAKFEQKKHLKSGKSQTLFKSAFTFGMWFMHCEGFALSAKINSPPLVKGLNAKILIIALSLHKQAFSAVGGD